MLDYIIIALSVCGALFYLYRRFRTIASPDHPACAGCCGGCCQGSGPARNPGLAPDHTPQTAKKELK